jgi:hypothetical protein
MPFQYFIILKNGLCEIVFSPDYSNGSARARHVAFTAFLPALLALLA